MTLSHISEVVPRVLPSRVTRLPDLVREFEEAEALDEEDTVLPLKDLRMDVLGQIAVPVRRSYALTDWSRHQLAGLLGIRWDRWFATAESQELAEEVNRRFIRANRTVRLRTARSPDGSEAEGVLRALVSPGYTPIADSFVAARLSSILGDVDPDHRVQRLATTDRTTSFVVNVGRPFRPGGSAIVGDVWGGVLVRNSGVGFASLLVSLSLIRLLCLNGMTAPLADAAFKRTHRAMDVTAFDAALREHLSGLPARLLRAGNVLGRAEERRIDNVEAEVSTVLNHARLPQRLASAVLEAWRQEPHSTAFGVSQALTLAAQSQSPELRIELERAAGNYLAATVGSN